MRTTLAYSAIPGRVLAWELRNLRRAAGLTHVDVANRLGWQQGKVSKIENAQQRVGVEAVIALAEVFHVAPEQRDRLVELAHAAREKGWWESYSDVLPATSRLYVGLESDADSIQLFGAETIPGLLQCHDYSNAMLTARSGRGNGLERRLEVLVERQRRSMRQREVKIDCVLSESAIFRLVGGKSVLAAQLRHLASLLVDSAVRLRVLPFAAGALPVEEPFSVFGYSTIAHPDIVFVRSPFGYRLFEEQDEVGAYTHAMRLLESLSLSHDESLRVIREREREVAR